MTIYRSMDEFDQPACVAALGTFDGVHLGHAQLLRRAVTVAREHGLPAVALTFDRHPMALVNPEHVPMALIDEGEKVRLFEELGLDGMVIEPFTAEFAAQTGEEYLRALANKLRPRVIVVGEDHRFGRGGKGDAALLRRMAPGLGYEAIVIPPVMMDGAPVSSTRIRQLIQKGDISAAERLAGHALARASC